MDKVALVTGGGNGIGRAIAMRLARDGISIGVLDLRADDAERVAREIAGLGGRAIGIQSDVSVRQSVVDAVSTLRATFGAINIVVNNAGITGFAPFLEITDDAWRRMLDVNLMSAFIVTQVVVPDMIAKGWGRIVNISSSSAQSGAVDMAHYSASKGGMIALTRTLALEFGKYNITSNTIPPRFIHNTVMSNEVFSKPEMHEHFRTMVAVGPIARHGEPTDIAGAAAWLVSEEAGYVTGQVIGVNGGRYI